MAASELAIASLILANQIAMQGLSVMQTNRMLSMPQLITLAVAKSRLAMKVTRQLRVILVASVKTANLPVPLPMC